MIQKSGDTTIERKIEWLETEVKTLSAGKNNDNHDINEILTDVARLKDSVEVIRERHAETAMNQKEMIQSVTASLKEFGSDFKLGMKELGHTVTQKFDSIEPRIQELERQKWKFNGAVALLAFILSIGVIVVAKYLPGQPQPQYQIAPAR